MSFRSMLARRIKGGGPLTADIKRSTLTADADGAYTRTWATIYLRVPGRFNALGAQDEAITWDQTKVMAEYVWYMETRASVNEGDRLYLGDRIFDIRLIQNWDEAGHYQKLALVEVRS
jgi:head-tail adaptor